MGDVFDWRHEANKERDATRFYCKKCYTMLMTDHPFYGALMFSTPIMNYKSFEELDADLTETDSRQFLNDLTLEERKNVPEWKGPAEHNYHGVTEICLPSCEEVGCKRKGRREISTFRSSCRRLVGRRRSSIPKMRR